MPPCSAASRCSAPLRPFGRLRDLDPACARQLSGNYRRRFTLNRLSYRPTDAPSTSSSLTLRQETSSQYRPGSARTLRHAVHDSGELSRQACRRFSPCSQARVDLPSCRHPDRQQGAVANAAVSSAGTRHAVIDLVRVRGYHPAADWHEPAQADQPLVASGHARATGRRFYAARSLACGPSSHSNQPP